MSAYLVVHISEVLDAETYARYRERAFASVERAGGRYLARGGAMTVLEGDWNPNRLIVVEFASVAAARAWWDSPGYAELKAMRQRSARTEMVVVEGVDGKEIS
jgi:uncharacterized protein (DUF1330 family)